MLRCHRNCRGYYYYYYFFIFKKIFLPSAVKIIIIIIMKLIRKIDKTSLIVNMAKPRFHIIKPLNSGV